MTRFPSSARLFAALVVLSAAACESPVEPPDSAFAQLTNLGGEEPAWSPDGTRIGFSSNSHDGNAKVHVMNADGSGVEQVTNHSGNDQHPAWFPDGTRIAFDSNGDRPLQHREIYVIRIK